MPSAALNAVAEAIARRDEVNAAWAQTVDALKALPDDASREAFDAACRECG